MSFGCLPSQTGNNFVYLEVSGEGEAYVEQSFDVPEDASAVTLRLWNALDPAESRVSVFVDDVETVLNVSTPESVQTLEDPNDLFSVICSGAEDEAGTYAIDEFAGMFATLRFGAIGGPGANGTILSYDDVVIETSR